VALALAVLIAAIGIGYAMSRIMKIRKELPEFAEEKPKRQSKREKRLEQIRSAEPEYTPPSIEDLVAAEIADEGLDDVPGGEDLAPTVKLKVYRRDAPRIDACPPEARRYVIAAGVVPSEAGVDDVHMICEGGSATIDEPTIDSESPTEQA
jgi:hypothetical protein